MALQRLLPPRDLLPSPPARGAASLSVRDPAHLFPALAVSNQSLPSSGFVNLASTITGYLLTSTQPWLGPTMRWIASLDQDDLTLAVATAISAIVISLLFV
jgi:hypothetical protein